MLGFDVSERTISRWMKRAPRDPDRAECWLTFLRNHREAIAGMDFLRVYSAVVPGVIPLLRVRSSRKWPYRA